MTEPPQIFIGNQTAFSAARAEIRQTAGAQGIRLSVHTRGSANPLRPDSWPVFLEDIALAQHLDAVLLNIHFYPEAGLESYVTGVEPLVRYLSKTHLLLSIENTPETTPEQINELFARFHALKRVTTAHVGMCLDIGHASLCASTQQNYLAYLDQLDHGVPIIHLHAHENWGDADTHLRFSPDRPRTTMPLCAGSSSVSGNATIPARSFLNSGRNRPRCSIRHATT